MGLSRVLCPLRYPISIFLCSLGYSASEDAASVIDAAAVPARERNSIEGGLKDLGRAAPCLTHFLTAPLDLSLSRRNRRGAAAAAEVLDWICSGGGGHHLA